MRRWTYCLLASALCVSLQSGLAQKLAWQSDAQAKPGGPQQVKFLYPEQVTVPAGKPRKAPVAIDVIAKK
jgi:hypothetical protein